MNRLLKILSFGSIAVVVLAFVSATLLVNELFNATFTKPVTSNNATIADKIIIFFFFDNVFVIPPIHLIKFQHFRL